jgi:hypothetical protein
VNPFLLVHRPRDALYLKTSASRSGHVMGVPCGVCWTPNPMQSRSGCHRNGMTCPKEKSEKVKKCLVCIYIYIYMYIYVYIYEPYETNHQPNMNVRLLCISS